MNEELEQLNEEAKRSELEASHRITWTDLTGNRYANEPIAGQCIVCGDDVTRSDDAYFSNKQKQTDVVCFKEACVREYTVMTDGE